MLFHSFGFLALFVITFIVYWSLTEHRARMAWLLAAGFVFYGSWNPWLISLILFSAGFDFVLAQRIEIAASPGRRRLLLILSVGVSLGLLGFFKYTNFLLDNAASILNLFGLHPHHPAIRIILPLGISFYTFETISYVVDVYRGRVPAERNFLNYALFLMFFPHLIAGPIVRPRDFLGQTRRKKRFDWNRLELGARLFLLGLVKKAVIADQMARIVDPVFAAPSRYASEAIWVAVLCYAAQIYCDFSGYSDMALGTAHAFGFKLPVNFNLPYAAGNISEFWRRWHMSLSSWLRDYLYIPLGGNRGSTLATYKNLMITMLLGGLWHGAGWNFVLWGVYHGALLSTHRALALRPLPGKRLFKPLRIPFTFLCVCLGWVLFRAHTIDDTWIILQRMLIPTEGQALATGSVVLAAAAWSTILLAHFAASFVDLTRLARQLPAPIMATGMAVVFLLTQVLMPSQGGAFIYFQF